MMVGDFEDIQIDLETDENDQSDMLRNMKKKIGDQQIIQLKDNILPRGLVPLERLFDANDVAVNQKRYPKMEKWRTVIQELNTSLKQSNYLKEFQRNTKKGMQIF